MHNYAARVNPGIPEMKDSPLEHFRSLQALARTGLHFCKDEYDRERYEAIERIA